MHWRNSNFQTIHFIIGKCHTADEAYRMVCQQLEEREQAVETTIVAEDKFKLRRLKAEKLLKSGDEIEQYEGEIEMKEIDNDFKWFKLNADEAVRELSFLKDCARKLEPFRKYRDQPDHIAHQMIQQEEWREELILRSKEFLVSSGQIPQDHLRTISLHPEFKDKILPEMNKIANALKNGEDPIGLMLDNIPKFKTTLLALEEKKQEVELK